MEQLLEMYGQLAQALEPPLELHKLLESLEGQKTIGEGELPLE